MLAKPLIAYPANIVNRPVCSISQPPTRAVTAQPSDPHKRTLPKPARPCFVTANATTSDSGATFMLSKASSVTMSAIHAKIVCWLKASMHNDVASKPNCSRRRGCVVASLRRPHHGAAINATSEATVESKPISVPLRPCCV